MSLIFRTMRQQLLFIDLIPLHPDTYYSQSNEKFFPDPEIVEISWLMVNKKGQEVLSNSFVIHPEKRILSSKMEASLPQPLTVAREIGFYESYVLSELKAIMDCYKPVLIGFDTDFLLPLLTERGKKAGVDFSLDKEAVFSLKKVFNEKRKKEYLFAFKTFEELVEHVCGIDLTTDNSFNRVECLYECLLNHLQGKDEEHKNIVQRLLQSQLSYYRENALIPRFFDTLNRKKSIQKSNKLSLAKVILPTCIGMGIILAGIGYSIAKPELILVGIVFSIIELVLFFTLIPQNHEYFLATGVKK